MCKHCLKIHNSLFKLNLKKSKSIQTNDKFTSPKKKKTQLNPSIQSTEAQPSLKTVSFQTDLRMKHKTGQPIRTAGVFKPFLKHGLILRDKNKVET